MNDELNAHKQAVRLEVKEFLEAMGDGIDGLADFETFYEHVLLVSFDQQSKPFVAAAFRQVAKEL